MRTENNNKISDILHIFMGISVLVEFLSYVFKQDPTSTSISHFKVKICEVIKFQDLNSPFFSLFHFLIANNGMAVG